MEIDENLQRAEFTPAQRAAAIHRRKELWEAMHPESGANCPTFRGRGNRRNFAPVAARRLRACEGQVCNMLHKSRVPRRVPARRIGVGRHQLGARPDCRKVRRSIAARARAQRERKPEDSVRLNSDAPVDKIRTDVEVARLAGACTACCAGRCIDAVGCWCGLLAQRVHGRPSPSTDCGGMTGGILIPIFAQFIVNHSVTRAFR